MILISRLKNPENIIHRIVDSDQDENYSRLDLHTEKFLCPDGNGKDQMFRTLTEIPAFDYFITLRPV